MLGFIMLYTFRYAFVADHYQYVASIGPIALAAAGMTRAFGSFEKKKPFLRPVLGGTLLLALSVLTWRQCGMYANPETLWRETLARNPNSFLAHNNLGNIYFRIGRMDEAMEHYQKALAIHPQYELAHNNLGLVLLQRERVDEAIIQYQKALEIQPQYVEAHDNLGEALVQSGRVDEAIAQFQMVVEIHPEYAKAHDNLGNVLLQKGRVDEAIIQYQKALEIQPDLAEANNNLGVGFLQKGQLNEAIVYYQKAVQLQPRNAAFQNNLGYALSQKGEVREAVAHYQESLEIQPQNAITCKNLAWILATCPEASIRNGTKAVTLAEQAVRLSGSPDPIFIGTLAAAYAEVGRFPEAVAVAERAQQLAAAQNNTALVNALGEQIERYQTGAPFRDAGQTDTPAYPGPP
jgi:tetratricopeptide (TPR) repeat protein